MSAPARWSNPTILRGKNGGSDPARGARKLRLHDKKKASLTRLAGLTRELGERVNTVYMGLAIALLKAHQDFF